jgi:hypothetical protein
MISNLLPKLNLKLKKKIRVIRKRNPLLEIYLVMILMKVNKSKCLNQMHRIMFKCQKNKIYLKFKKNKEEKL